MVPERTSLVKRSLAACISPEESIRAEKPVLAARAIGTRFSIARSVTIERC
jgi:hypothetical protein